MESEIWIQKKHAELFPFKAGASCSSVPNFMAKFSRREGDKCTEAFIEALTLSEMYVDDANSNRDEVFKLLKMGFTKRQQIVAVHKGLSIHKQNCFDEAHRMEQRYKKRRVRTSTERIHSDQVIDDEVVTPKDADSCARRKRKKVVAPKCKVVSVTKASKTACKHNGVAKKSHVRPLMKSTSNKTSMALIARANRNPSPQVVTKKRNKRKDPSKSIPVASNVSRKRRTCSVEAQAAPDSKCMGQSILPKDSRRKHNGAEKVCKPPLASNRTEGRVLLESQSQSLQKAKTKRDSSGIELCAHNCRPYNCPKCRQHTFVSWKPRTNDDVLDDVA